MNILKKLILDRNQTLKIADFTAGKNGTLLIEQDEIGGHDLLLPADLKYRGEVKLNKLPNTLTLIKWVIDDEGVLFSVSYPAGAAGSGGDLFNYYTKGQSDSLFYPLLTNPAGYVNQSWVTNQGYIKGEADTLDSVLKRGNLSGEDMTVTGKVSLSGELTIPTVEPLITSNGNIWVGSVGTGSTLPINPVITKLIDLADVGISNIINNQILSFDSVSNKWINKTINVDLSNFYTKIQSDSKYSGTGHTHTFASLTSKPTTIGGYGITDVYTKTESDGKYKGIGYVPTWTEIASKPTTISGYGITDSYTKSEVYTKVEADGKYYLKTNPSGYISAEVDTLNSVVTRGNSTGLPVVFSGVTTVSKQLNVPLVAPLVNTNGSVWVGSVGTGSTIPINPVITKLVDLADVSISNLITGQSPVWNSISQKWENKNVTGYLPLTGGTLTGALFGTGIADFVRFYGNSSDLVTAPSFSFTDNSNTGMWNVSFNTLGFTTAGINRLTVGTASIVSTLPVNTPVLNGGNLVVDNNVISSGNGLSLYAGAVAPAGTMPTYGIAFAGTASFGTHGAVTADWATYFTMTTAGRGWIFKGAATGTGQNVASIGINGVGTFAAVTAPNFYGALNGTVILTNNNNFNSAPFSLVGKNSGTDNNLYTYSSTGVKLALNISDGSTLINNISGNATTATTATNWGVYTNQSSAIPAMDFAFGRNANNIIAPVSQTVFRTWLGWDSKIDKASIMLGSSSINTISLGGGSGIYRSEVPTDGNIQYQPLLSLSGAGDRGWQIIGNSSSALLQWRGATAAGGVTTYGTWQQIYHSGNIATLKADIGLSGYLPLTGGVLTGQLTTNATSGIVMRGLSATGNNYLQFYNNTSTRMGYVGYPSTTTNDLYFNNDLGANKYLGTSHDFNTGVKVGGKLSINWQTEPTFQFSSYSGGNSTSAAAFLMGEYYGPLVGSSSVSGSIYAFRVMAGLSNIGAGGTAPFTVWADGKSTFIGSVTAPSFVGGLTGNASTATTLQTARTIWGQSFNGSANITGALTGVTTITATVNITAPEIKATMRMTIPTTAPTTPVAGDIWIA